MKRQQTLKLSKIKSNPENPRMIKDDKFKKLVQSLKDFPVMTELREVLLDENDVIIGGNMRDKAAKEAGWTEISVKYFTREDAERNNKLTEHNKTYEEYVKELVIKDNISGGEWDWDMIANQYDSIELDVWGLDLPDKSILEPEIEEDEAPEVSSEPPKSKLGEIYQLGRHRVMCGDSTDTEALNTLLDGVKPELLFTDPPYKFETQGGGVLKNSRQMNEVKANKVNEFDPTTLEAQCKTNIYFHNKTLIKDYAQLAQDWNLAYDLAIYKKQGLPNWSGHLMTDIEYIAIIGSLDPNKGMDMPMYSKVYEGKKDQDNELSYSKPVELCVKFIKLYSDKTVLDIFLGSGSTLIACEQTDRICYGMELDPKYVDVIRKRYAKYCYPDTWEERWEELTPAISGQEQGNND